MPSIDLGRIALHYDASCGREPAILLIHELGGSSASFAALSALLAPHRRVIAPDLRGAGLSEKPPALFSIDDCADDLAALLTALGIESCEVLGAALGCYVGLKLALRHPRLVRRLTVCAVAPDISDVAARYVSERAERVRRAGMRIAVDASLGNSFPDSHAELRAAYRAAWLGNDPAGYAALSLALACCGVTAVTWAQLTCPVQVASGAGDFLWPPEVGRQVAAAIPGARFTVLDRAGHFPHVQAPDDVAALVLGWTD